MTAQQEFDGIFDAFSSLSKAMHRQSEINRLSKDNANLKRKCGSCDYWMTTYCPLEVKGVKINCNHNICPSFQMTKWVSEFIEKNENIIKEFENTQP